MIAVASQSTVHECIARALARQRLSSPTSPFGPRRHARCKVPLPSSYRSGHMDPSRCRIVSPFTTPLWMGRSRFGRMPAFCLACRNPLSPSASGPPLHYIHPPSNRMTHTQHMHAFRIQDGQAARKAKHAAAAARAKDKFLLVIDRIEERGADMSMMAPTTVPPAAAVAAGGSGPPSPPPTEATPLSLRSDRSGSGHCRPPTPLSPSYHKWRRRLRLLLLLAL